MSTVFRFRTSILLKAWRYGKTQGGESDDLPAEIEFTCGGSAMKRLLGSLWLLLLLVVPPAVLCGPATANKIGITHVNIVDPATHTVRADQTVLISGGRIEQIGPATAAQLPADFRVVDARGKFLMAGLWDMHVHLAGISADPSWSKQVLLPLLLANGIVGVRDMGGDLETLLAWKRDSEVGRLLAPHIITAGPWLAAGGKKSPEQYPVGNAEAARASVRDLQQRGADFIKIISLPSRDAFFAVAEECRKQKISFAGHLPLEVSAIEASEAGMRSIEHFFYSAFSLSLSSKEDDLRAQMIAAQRKGDAAAWVQVSKDADATYDPEKAAHIFQTFQKNGTWVTPTLASMKVASRPELWSTSDPLLAFVPPALAKEWRDSVSNERAKKRAAWLAQQVSSDWKLTGELHRAGVAQLVGSDSLDTFMFPGDSLHQELAELVRAGFTPGEALQAATEGAAQFLQHENDFGTVATGKSADLVLLEANPLDDIGNTRKIIAVVRGGNYLDRGTLDRMLAQAKAAAAAVSPSK